MFYDEDEDDDLDREGEFDEDEEENEDDEETLKELDVDENGHVVEGHRRHRKAGYDDFEENSDPEWI
jgi:hypothetical protein